MYTVFSAETSTGTWYGIENEGGILYEADFDTQEEAQNFADAHNKGARSYSEASAMIYGLEDGEQSNNASTRTSGDAPASDESSPL